MDAKKWTRSTFVNNMIRQAEQNPLAVTTLAVGLVQGVAKLIDARGNSVGSRAYNKQVKYRIKQDRKARKQAKKYYARY